MYQNRLIHNYSLPAGLGHHCREGLSTRHLKKPSLTALLLPLGWTHLPLGCIPLSSSPSPAAQPAPTLGTALTVSHWRAWGTYLLPALLLLQLGNLPVPLGLRQPPPLLLLPHLLHQCHLRGGRAVVPWHSLCQVQEEVPTHIS